LVTIETGESSPFIFFSKEHDIPTQNILRQFRKLFIASNNYNKDMEAVKGSYINMNLPLKILKQ